VFRHADREEAVEGDDSDPDISADGQRRAVRLALMLRKYKIDRVFSTNYARTLQTVTPLSRMRKVDVEIYEPSESDALLRVIAESATRRRIAVAGHNSTAFALVNKLLKADKYEMPADSQYGNLWIIKIRKGKIRERLIVY
jgi:broad specificity phosphatase PhoE